MKEGQGAMIPSCMIIPKRLKGFQLESNFGKKERKKSLSIETTKGLSGKWGIKMIADKLFVYFKKVQGIEKENRKK
jgi:hypothetical protein